MSCSQLFRFFDLMPELRNHVYELLFENHIVDCEASSYETPGILLASKQTFVEAHGAYYRRSTFHSTGSVAAEKRLSALSAAYLPLVENVHIDTSSRMEGLYGKGRSSRVGVEDEILFDVAYLAECAVVWVRQGLKEEGCDQIDPNAIQASIKTRANDVVFTAKPFETFKDAFMQSSFAAMGDRPIPLVRATLQAQARYFDFDHVNPRKCWHRLWAMDAEPNFAGRPSYECGCPKKVPDSSPLLPADLYTQQ